MDEWRSGQIPKFGNWDHANELPITQYFECARQAGLVRYSNSTGECNLYIGGDHYSSELSKPSRNFFAHPKKTRMREKRGGPQFKEQKKQSKVCDMTDLPRKQRHPQQQQLPSSYNVNKLPVRLPKAVDEDLYKIPPELLRSSKRRNKRPGLFSCLVPSCAS